ncbi:glycosyltransferase family 4 protein [Desulfogranum mediterraneum]|uniref:glycosyltransferase family 4 protein n=1 Tax=Desulfogranum mediterraneum TaxID=160661 RepID=UPI00040395BD|nr:glycosyltransferase family 4 protein [Desulfogranum mediterraneum]
MKTIAYLAPEIPALSATFVYNEILALEEQGYTIVPISIHEPSSPARDKRLAHISDRTHYVYKNGFLNFLLAGLLIFLFSPRKFLQVLATVSRDSLQLGLLNRVRIGLFYRLLASFQVALILRRKKCDHIHSHFAHVPTDIAMYASALAGIPFSFTSHANDLFERCWLLQEKIARSKFAATISEYNRRFIASKGGDISKVHIIRCGVDSSRFAPSSCLQQMHSPCKIGSLGRMVEKKGFDALLQAAAILLREGMKFRLSLAGSGPLEIDLRRLSHELGIDQVVDFPGPIPNEEVPTWLNKQDIFILPCQQDINGDKDGIPVVLMEAMLCEVPVISTNISGIPELITHEEEGLLTSQRSPEELSTAIKRLMNDVILLNRVKLKAAEKIKSEFDVNINAGKLINLIST